jgi:hypothetical protein
VIETESAGPSAPVTMAQVINRMIIGEMNLFIAMGYWSPNDADYRPRASEA